MSDPRDAIGRVREVSDPLYSRTAAQLAALFGVPEPKQALPPTWHWAYFQEVIPFGERGPDLHERTGRFLPEMPFPRRMWAGGEIVLHRPLRLGVEAEKRTTVADVVQKEGRSGPLAFVTVRHEIGQNGELSLEESQTLVYRTPGPAEKPLRRADDPIPTGYHTFTDGLLYLYSAITLNGHRIHWDRKYCREVEGYPDLVVHAPLMATALCDMLYDGGSPVRFAFRAEAPVFDTSPVRLVSDSGGTARIERSDGVTAMYATLQLVD